MGSEGRTHFRLDVGTERVLHVAGELDLATRDAFRTSLTGAIEGGQPVIVDITSVSFLDSSGLAVLLSARLDGVDVRLRGVSPLVRRTLDVAGVTEMLPLEP